MPQYKAFSHEKMLSLTYDNDCNLSTIGFRILNNVTTNITRNTFKTLQKLDTATAKGKKNFLVGYLHSHQTFFYSCVHPVVDSNDTKPSFCCFSQ